MSREGHIPFSPPNAGKECQTYYKAFGDLRSSAPLIIIHGGPGAAHDYLLGLSALHERYNIPLIFYDQLGCGQSTPLPEKAGDSSFWNIALFQSELDNLIDSLELRSTGFSVLGHSWGGMMASSWAAKRLRGLQKLILANTPASMQLWIDAQNGLRATLPADAREVLDRGEREDKFDSPEYGAALTAFAKQYCCRTEPWPAPELQLALKNLLGENTAGNVMYGPTQLVVSGTLKTWSAVDECKDIDTPTLLLNGAHDIASNATVKPFFTNISKVKWVMLEKASHYSHVELPDRFVELVGDFLASP